MAAWAALLTAVLAAVCWLAARTLTAVPTTWPVGLAVCGAWALAAWVLGAVLLERRDV